MLTASLPRRESAAGCTHPAVQPARRDKEGHLGGKSPLGKGGRKEGTRFHRKVGATRSRALNDAGALRQLGGYKFKTCLPKRDKSNSLCIKGYY